MLWIHAKSVVTQMINNKSLGNRTHKELVGVSMSALGPIILVPELTVTRSLTDLPGPLPAVRHPGRSTFEVRRWTIRIDPNQKPKLGINLSEVCFNTLAAEETKSLRELRGIATLALTYTLLGVFAEEIAVNH